jgi:hypothetical protein
LYSFSIGLSQHPSGNTLALGTYLPLPYLEALESSQNVQFKTVIFCQQDLGPSAQFFFRKFEKKNKKQEKPSDKPEKLSDKPVKPSDLPFSFKI